MKKNRSILLGLVVGISALAFSSCAYDPYYAGGYGDGYGYGSSGFSTTYFVRTGNPRWAYDPYAGAYYDYTRRAYYDPYLYGYYPVGYRPRYVYGAPHPHGWKRGSGYCPPPSKIRSYNLRDYRDRGERYRSLGRSWSNNVRINAPGRDQRSRFGDRDGDRRSGFGDRDRDRRPGFGDRDGDRRSGFGDRDRSRNDWMQRSSRDGRDGRSGSVFGNRGGDNNRGNFFPQRGGGSQPDFRSRDRSSDDRSDRSRSFGRGSSPSPTGFSFPSRDNRSRDWSNRGGGRPAPQFERREGGSRERQAAPSFQRQPPQFERRERGGGSGRGDSDRGGRDRIRGLGEG